MIRRLSFQLGLYLTFPPALILAYIASVGPAMGFGSLSLILSGPVGLTLILTIGVGVGAFFIWGANSYKQPLEVLYTIAASTILPFIVFYIMMTMIMNTLSHRELWFLHG